MSLTYHELELQIALDERDPRNALPPITPDKRRILDIGCGGGQTLAAANKYGATAVGLDPDFTAVRSAPLVNEITYLCCAKGEALPLADETFDLVFSRVAIPYMHIPSALREMHRVLARGGELWLVLHTWNMLSERVRNSLARPNFKDVIFCGYICLNTLALYFGRQFRFPANGRYESVQTEASITWALRRAGFTRIKIKRNQHFAISAFKPNR